MAAFEHIPVLLAETVAALRPAAGERFVDCTLGGGGHTEALLEAADCSVIGLDRDPSAIAAASARLARFGDRFQAVRARFSEVGAVLDRLGIDKVDGILADIGVSSPQIDDAARGFSFRFGGPIDMRMDPDATISAADLVNDWAEEALAEVIRDYGEERQWRRIAGAIVAGRPWSDTAALAHGIAKAVGGRKGDRIHPATKTFQAIRIAVNDELGELERLLAIAIDRLRPGGRLAIISFHSLEDRMVKQHLAREAGRGMERDPYGNPVVPPRLTALHDVAPSDSDPNPRARSARLRSATRLPWNAR